MADEPGTTQRFSRTTDRDFSDAEYATRRARLSKEMRETGLDALIVNQEHNYRYLTGHASTLWINTCRPLIAVFTPDGVAHTLAIVFEVPAVQKSAYAVEVVAYAGTGVTLDPMFQALGPLLDDLLGPSPRIGYEASHQLAYAIPEVEMVRLQGLRPDATFVDASPLLWDLRLVKSGEEINAVRTAAAVNTEAFGQVAESSLLGCTSDELYRRFYSYLLDGGSEGLGYVSVGLAPGSRRVEKDAPVFIDSGAVVAGYLSDFNRYFVHGSASPVAHDTLARLREVSEIVYEEMRPGRTYAEAYAAVARRSIAILPDVLNLERSLLGRLAHGIGQAMPEPPSLSFDDNSEIVAGTLLCVEPTVVTDEGPFVLEEMVVIRDHGCELLSDGTGAIIRQL